MKYVDLGNNQGNALIGQWLLLGHTYQVQGFQISKNSDLLEKYEDQMQALYKEAFDAVYDKNKDEQTSSWNASPMKIEGAKAESLNINPASKKIKKEEKESAKKSKGKWRK